MLPKKIYFAFCPDLRTTINNPAAANKQQTQKSSPPLNDPVASRIYPIAYGPTKPPRLPMLFIMAIAPAAAVAVKIICADVSAWRFQEDIQTVPPKIYTIFCLELN
ncbi:MAG: hypothetical protein ABFD82_00775 [Syntrophaceae bacterium]